MTQEVWTRVRVESVIYEPWCTGKTMVEVARNVGISRQRAYVLLKKYGFPTCRRNRARSN